MHHCFSVYTGAFYELTRGRPGEPPVPGITKKKRAKRAHTHAGTHVRLGRADEGGFSDGDEERLVPTKARHEDRVMVVARGLNKRRLRVRWRRTAVRSERRPLT